MILKYIIILAVSLSILTSTSGQVGFCGSHKYCQDQTNSSMKLNLKKCMKAFHAWKQSPQKSVNGVMIIPVHFVVHHFPCDKYGEGSNISEQLILSQLNILNEFFAAENPDTINIPEQFSTKTSKIKFCLANTDPEGNLSDGITRYASYEEFEINDSLILSKTIWPRDQYLNIYVSPNIVFTSGYAPVPLPDSLPDLHNDAVRLTLSSFGSPVYNPISTPLNAYSLGRVAIHEVGHWLGLNHIWGPWSSDGDCDVDDGIEDTPLQFTFNRGCPTHPSPSCDNDGDMFINHMDYTDDSCRVAFSAQQVEYMEFILQDARSSLLDSGCKNCCADDLPKIMLNSKTDLDCFDENNGSFEVFGYNGLPPYSYSINGTDFQESGRFENLSKGVYMVTIKDSEGRESRRPVILNSPTPITTSFSINEANCLDEPLISLTFDLEGGGYGPRSISLSNGSISFNIEESGIEQDFENGYPSDWLLQSAWRYGTTEALSGSGFDIPPRDNCLAWNDSSNPNQSGGASVYSNTIDISEVNSYFISFDAFFENYDWFADEEAIFMISTDNANSYQEIINLPGSNDWETYKFEFQNQNASALRLRFEYRDGGGWLNGFALDNVNVYTNSNIHVDNLNLDTYTMEVNYENGCVYSDEIIISLDDIIQLESLEIDQPTCISNGQILLDANSVNGIANYSIDDTSNTNGLFRELSAGVYQVTIADNLGCETTKEIELLPWDLSLEAITIACSSQPVEKYEIQVCTNNDQEVIWNLIYENAVLEQVLDSMSCVTFDLSEQVSASNEPSTYIFEAIDQFNCSSQISLMIEPPIELVINAVDTVYICAESDGYNLIIENASAFETIEISSSGGIDLTNLPNGSYLLANEDTYVINAVDFNGCDIESTVFLTRFEALSIASIQQSAANSAQGGTIQVAAEGGEGPYVYTLLNETNVTGGFTDLEPGNYELIVTDANDCQLIFDFTIELMSAISDGKQNLISFFPNPCIDFVTIQSNSRILKEDIQIYDASFQKIGKWTFMEDGQKLNFNSLASGIYFVHIKSKQLDFVIKQVKL